MKLNLRNNLYTFKFILYTVFFVFECISVILIFNITFFVGIRWRKHVIDAPI